MALEQQSNLYNRTDDYQKKKSYLTMLYQIKMQTTYLLIDRGDGLAFLSIHVQDVQESFIRTVIIPKPRLQQR